MTVLTVNINDKKDAKALEALKAVIAAFDLNYDLENDTDFVLSSEQKIEILRREVEYKSGRMKLHTIDEVKASLNFKD
jgi:hypothetical protein